VYTWHTNIEKLGLVIFIVFAFFSAIQFYYYLRVYLPVLFYKKKGGQNTPPLSVVICAKNESHNLKKNLPYVLNQDYPDFEVIVVDDGSTDNTGEILGEYISMHKNLKTTSIPIPNDPKFSHGKKLAVTVGVKSAKNEWVIFTDADCFPESDQWLRNIAQKTDSKEIILGYGGYQRQKSLLNNFIRFETVNIALMYLGYAIARKPYMGIGRNLAYKKKLFLDNKGFANNYGIQSGDDDLFINETATASNTSVTINSNSFTRSEAAKTWKNLFHQKTRHLTTANKYKSMHSFMIGMEPLSRAWFYFLLAILLITNSFFIPTLAIVGSRFIIQLIIYIATSQRFKEKNIWVFFIFFDLFSLFFNFLAYFALIIRPKQIKWR